MEEGILGRISGGTFRRLPKRIFDNISWGNLERFPLKIHRRLPKDVLRKTPEGILAKILEGSFSGTPG